MVREVDEHMAPFSRKATANRINYRYTHAYISCIFRNTFSYNRDRILFRNVDATSGDIGSTSDFQSRSTSLRRYTRVYNTQWARAHQSRGTCRPRDARPASITVVLIELLFQLMSTFIIRVRAHTRRRRGMGKHTHPAQGVAARSHKSAGHSSSRRG